MKQKLILLTVLLTAFSAFSTEYFVAASRPDDSGAATNWATAKKTIQAAVDLTANGDTVWVTNGTYAPIVVTNAIFIRSVSGYEKTIIDGDNAQRCAKLSEGVLLDGLTVINGYAAGGGSWFDGCGGGVYCEASTVILNCVITSNQAKNSGSGIWGGSLSNCLIRANLSQNTGGGAVGSSLNNCVISDNVSFWLGGGAFDCQLNDCLISNNYSAGWGAGGAYESSLSNCVVVGNSTAATGGGARECTLNNSLVIGNQAEFGGGAHECTLINCTVTENIATTGGGVAFNVLRNSIVFNNSASENSDCYWNEWSGGLDARYSCFSEATAGLNGNINSDPKFVNASAGNYRLQSESPCVNAGINADVSGAVDLDGNERIVHTYVDMGAYESTYNSPKQYIRDFLPTNGTTFSVTNTLHLSANGGGSGNPITFAALSGCPVVWVNSTTMQFSAGGDIYITASQAGDSYYAAAETVTNHYFVPYNGIFYVDASRLNDDGTATNWATAKRTIQAAVKLADNGSTIWVANGTYILSAEISITSAIAIRSVNGPGTTIVDGNGATRCFNLNDSACLVGGFTIQNGNTRYMVEYEGEYGGLGGGVSCESSMPVVSNCILTANYASGDWDVPSGGWYMGSSGGGMQNGTAVDCTFSSNTATRGAGMSDGVAINCMFVGNQGEGSGPWGSCGGAGKSGGEAYNCTFVDNFSLVGSGMSQGTAYNCVFSSNTAYIANDLYNSTAYNSCSLYLEFGVNGNITNDPLFVDAANGDFRLQSNSPCINWGNNSVVSNTTDLGGNSRIVEGVVDMGAYEYQGIIGLADSDSDGIADDWERQHGGNQNPETICSNGVNTILQAYIAGLDPNDPQSRFLTTVLPGRVLRWNATSGRVYSVYYSTNLMNGFQPFATNIPWTAGAFTDSVHSADGQRFYKIGVELK